MSILSEYQYAFQKKESFYLLFLVILIYILTSKSSFSFNQIVFLFPAAIVGYIYYTRTVDKNFTSMHIQNEKLKKIDVDAYPYLQEDIEVIDLLIQLEDLFYINRLQYIEVFKRLNRFYQISSDFKNTSKDTATRPTDLYQMAKESSKMAFNALLSFAIQVDSVSERRRIERAVEGLQRRCQLALNEMETSIQEKWNHGEINVNSQPIYPDEPEPSVLSDVQYSRHYNIY